MKNYSHKHATPNPIMLQEERSILLCVERAKTSSNNSQTLGRNGELPLVDFLNRYLPSTLKAASGHFITQEGSLSPQIDVLILDSRYPLLAHNTDGSVLAMAHSVIETLEVKTNLTTKDVKKINTDAKTITQLLSKEKILGGYPKLGAIATSAIAFNCSQRLDTLEKIFIESSNPKEFSADITILRYPEKDLNLRSGVGGAFHFEYLEDPNTALISDELRDTLIKNDHLFMSISSHTPLSDFYYRLVQDAYYSLGTRNYAFDDIGNHFNKYMSWATANWDEI